MEMEKPIEKMRFIRRLITDKKIKNKYVRKTEDTEISLQDVLRMPTLTKRDRDVLLSLYYHRCLTSKQIAEIHFRYGKNGYNNQAELIARRRLRKLFDLKLVDRFFVFPDDGQGSSAQHVILDTLGAHMVAGMLNLPFEDLEWRYDMNDVRLPYLDHMILINDFYVWLLKWAREHGHTIDTFLVENHVRHEFKYKRKKIKFNPDAYGRYYTGDEGFHFFFEMDNGTMTLQTFKKKLERYEAFFASEEYKKYYGDSFPLILVVAPDEERAISLRNTIYADNNYGLQWLFTTKELAEANPVGEIWLGTEKEPVGLLT